ncbi:MAG: MipA/OmpV family protein [Desulfovibrio sp.]|nr:MipA/OmpV family protein [Desulfovibrio sp.]
MKNCIFGRLILLALLTFALGAPVPARAQEAWEENPADAAAQGDKWGFNVGAGASLRTSEYKGIDSLGSPLPLLGYESKWLYLRGLSGGVHVYRDRYQEFNVQLSYLPQNFYADWSDDSRMKRLDDRYSSLMAGLNYTLRTQYGHASATLSTDILGVNNGIMADVSYAYPLRFENVMFMPAVGVQWTDSNYNDYYYSISTSESRASGLKEYSPENAFSPYAGLTMRVIINEDWSAIANARALFLGNEITDSPMVERSTTYSFSAGLLYAF